MRFNRWGSAVDVAEPVISGGGPLHKGIHGMGGDPLLLEKDAPVLLVGVADDVGRGHDDGGARLMNRRKEADKPDLPGISHVAGR